MWGTAREAEGGRNVSNLPSATLQGQLAQVGPLVGGGEDEVVFEVSFGLLEDDLECDGVREQVGEANSVVNPLLDDQLRDGLLLAGDHLIVHISLAIQTE